MKRIDHNAAGDKWCYSCKLWLPANDTVFYRSKYNWDALSNRCRRCDKEAAVKSCYGISIEEYAQLIEAGCAICGAAADVAKMELDHCHATGQIRGGLCNRCNTAIAQFSDDGNLMRSAAAYVERFQ